MFGRRGIRSADREQMSDKTRMPQRYSVDDRAPPRFMSSPGGTQLL